MLRIELHHIRLSSQLEGEADSESCPKESLLVRTGTPTSASTFSDEGNIICVITSANYSHMINSDEISC